jgi:hypothetical protein
MAQYLNTVASRLLPACNQLLDILDKHGTSDFPEGIPATYVALTHLVYNAVIQSGSTADLHPTIKRLMDEDAALHFVAVAGAIAKIKTKVLCNSPKCLRTNEGSERAFQLCNGCHLMRYCGRECQKDHWSWQPYPHKQTCGELKTLAAVRVLFFCDTKF